MTAGFMRGLDFPDPGPRRVVFAVPARNGWGAAAVELHAERRREAARLAVELEGVGFARVGLVDGVALAMREGDPRPSWSLTGETAVALLAAQLAWLAVEVHDALGGT